MSDVRMSRAKKNIAASLLGQIVTLICGLIVPGILLRAFGSEVYGACSSITQFLSYIALLEGGIGGVARAVLYKPLAENDNSTISAILSEIRRFFRVILLIFGIYVLILACTFHRLSHVESLDWLTTFFLVIVISLSTFAQYYIGISNSILLQAAQRSYITSWANIISTICNAVCVVILVSLNCSIIVIKLASSLIYVIKPILYWLYVRHIWHPAKVSDKSTVYLTQKWSGLGQHLAYFLHSNTDVVILTFFADLKAVAVYSVYNMVVTHIQNLATSFVAGMEALFGDMLAKKEYSQLNRTFDTYETIISLVTVLLFSVTEVLIVSFVKIYTRGLSDTNYEAPLFACLLLLAAVLYCLRMPYHSLVIAAGHFKQTELASYGEACINVVLSIALVSRLGLVGVAIGTVTATLFRFLYYVLYLSKHIASRKPIFFAKRFLANAVSFAICCISGKLIVSHIPINSYTVWGLCGIAVFILAAVIVLGINILFYREICLDWFKTTTAQLKENSKKI